MNEDLPKISIVTPSSDQGGALQQGIADDQIAAIMTVAIDLYPLIPGVSGGIVPWVKGVLRAMARQYPDDRIVMFHRPGRSPIEIEESNIVYVELPEHPKVFYEAMTAKCRNMGIQVVVRSYPQELHPDVPWERQIFIIPDIQHEYLPEFFTPDVLANRRRAFTQALSSGGAVATMTHHSRSAIMERGAVLCNDVFLMPAALPEELSVDSDEADLPDEAKTFDRYFYMPGNLWPHKNHRRLLEAFAKALPSLPANTGLVLTGSPEGAKILLRDFADFPVVHLGFVPHSQVAALFKNATALVYFSLFEGFGMPLLEAFRHRTPVLCSDRTSLPEVGGDAVLTCDPMDIDAMAALMRRIIKEPDTRADLVAKGEKRLAVYGWDEPAQALRAAIKRRASASVRVLPEPLVSIVMPTRNHAHFIRASIDSVLMQDYPHLELIVMDGASTDDTVDILKSYGDRIRWVSEPDKGQTDAINKGMNLARGEVLAYLNSDDLLLPDAVQKVVRKFQQHPECDMLYGAADYIDEDGVVTGSYLTDEYSFHRLMHDCCVCQPAAFWRRRITDRIGPFDETLQTAMDYEYWLRMDRQGGIIRHTRDKLAQSRLHKDAKTLAMRGTIFDEIFRICRTHGGYVSLSYYLGLWSYKLYETWPGGPRLRRILPQVYYFPALAHFTTQIFYLKRNQAARRYVARTAFNVVDRCSTMIGSVIRKTWRKS